MSYCRFSSANWKCDVYVYDGSEGITIHTASTRFEGYIPKMPNIMEVSNQEWHEAYLKRNRFIKKCVRVKIDSEEAGKTTYHRTPEEAVKELRFLQYEGFFVPEWVFTDLEEYYGT